MGAEPRRRRREAQAPLDVPGLREAGLAYVARYSASAAMLRRTLERTLDRAERRARRAAVDAEVAALAEETDGPPSVCDPFVAEPYVAEPYVAELLVTAGAEAAAVDVADAPAPLFDPEDALDPDAVRAARKQVVDQAMAGLAALGAINDAAFAQGRAASLFRRGAPPRAIQDALRVRGVAPEAIAAALDALREERPDQDLGLIAAVRLAKRRRLGPWRRNPTLRAEKRTADIAALARSGCAFDHARQAIDGDADALDALLRGENPNDASGDELTRDEARP